MQVIFRVDSSKNIGSGHVIRCLRIANKLRDKSADCSFICKELSGSLIKLIKDQGFKVFLLSQEIKMPNKNSSIIVDKLFNWKTDALQTAEILKNLQTNTLIVDHYGIDKKWEDYQKPYCKKIMAIDDLDNRKHSVDIILDQNLFPNIQKRYLKNSNKNCRKFIGLEYAFLDPNFIKKRKFIRRQKKEVSKIFIYLGNTGSSNILRRILKVFIDNSLNKFKIEVIFTGDAEEKNKIINLSRNHKFIKILDTQPNLADIMSSADLSIGAGGLTTWERIYLGLPSAVITVADNQKECSEYLNSLGLIWLIGHHDQIDDNKITDDIKKILSSENLIDFSKRCLSVNVGTKSSEVINEILV
tara:strand:+ start:29216 stop:30286 length:1071 start_codon:yes stop_codon:yes gene_type:complete